MNSIEQFKDYIKQKYPAAKVELTPPLRDGGIWSLDVDSDDKQLTIQWSAATGFGISSVSPENFGEGPDEVHSTLKQAKSRVSELLETHERTSPPLRVLLSRLRERRGFTQQELAGRLGVRQATISGMEHRDDVQLSTLRRFIDALGGVIQILVHFPDAHYRIDLSPLARPSQQPPVLALEEPSRMVGVAVHHETSFVRLRETGELQRAREMAGVIRANNMVIEMSG
jgi:transcriptional regulator with XRE-family HTH domain